MEVGEWTIIEISLKEVDGKYFHALAVGGHELGRREVSDPEQRKLVDVKVVIGSPAE